MSRKKARQEKEESKEERALGRGVIKGIREVRGINGGFGIGRRKERSRYRS